MSERDKWLRNAENARYGRESLLRLASMQRGWADATEARAQALLEREKQCLGLAKEARDA